MSVANIASHLSAMAEQQPDSLAIAVQLKNGQSEKLTFRQLDELSNLISRGLQESGIKKGSRTVMMVKPGLNFFILAFALYKINAVLVAVDPGLGIKKLGHALDEAEPQAFIGIPAAHIARKVFGWAKQSIETNILVCSSFTPRFGMKRMKELYEQGKDSNREAFNMTSGDDTAAILFTSGSTGIPKGVIYSHANFIAQVELLKSLYNIKPGEIDLSTFPLFALFAPAMGMTSVIPDMDFTRPGNVNPQKIFNAIEQYKVTTMFGSPALLKRVAEAGQQDNRQLPNVNRVISAGAPVHVSVIKKFSLMLNSDTQIHTPYGATESLPVSSIGSSEILGQFSEATAEGKGVCVGKPVIGVEVKIVKISDLPIERWSDEYLMPTNEIGEIIVKGPQVTRGYYNKIEQTKLAKIFLDKDNFYHRMGDLGYFDDEGRLWFCGRKSQRVILENRDLYTINCEGVFNCHEKVSRTALVPVRENGHVIPAICVELNKDGARSHEQQIINELKELGTRYDHTRLIEHFVFHPSFPVDIRHNAKIGRELLAEWAQKQIN